MAIKTISNFKIKLKIHCASVSIILQCYRKKKSQLNDNLPAKKNLLKNIVDGENVKYKMKNSTMINENYALQINRWCLESLGIWQFVMKSSYFAKITAVFLIIICTFLLGFIIIPGILFAFVLIKDPAIRLQVSGVLSFCVMGIMKYYYLNLKKEQISDCINHLISDWKKISNYDDKMIMISYAKFGRYSSILSAIFMYASSVFYAGILPFMSPGMKNEDNITMRNLAYPCHFIIFDEHESPAYEIVFFIQCCCSFVMASITNGACNLATVFIMHACGQLEILTSWLNNIRNNDRKSKDMYSKYSAVIEQHATTLRFINKVEKLFQQICFVEVVGCTLNICLLGYYTLIGWSQNDTGGVVTYLLLLTSFVYNIFLYCYMGEMLTQKCQGVSNVVYLTDWYELPVKLARGFILSIVIAQNYEPLKAGKLIFLSINTFGTVIRTSVAYLNILRTFMA